MGGWYGRSPPDRRTPHNAGRFVLALTLALSRRERYSLWESELVRDIMDRGGDLLIR